MSYVPLILVTTDAPWPNEAWNTVDWRENVDSGIVESPTQPTGVFVAYVAGNNLPITYSIKFESGLWYDNGIHEPFSITSSAVYDTSQVISDSEYIYLWNGSGNSLGRIKSPYWDPPPSIVLNGYNLVDTVLTYDVTTNKLSWIIPASFQSTSDPLIQAHRTDYVLQRDSDPYDTYLIHTNGIITSASSNHYTVAGIWKIRIIISMPSPFHNTLAQIEVTQAQIDSHYAAAAQALLDAAAAQALLDAAAAQALLDAAAAQALLDAAAAQALLDAAAAQLLLDAAAAAAAAAAEGNNVPSKTPRSRRGNHNFW